MQILSGKKNQLTEIHQWQLQLSLIVMVSPQTVNNNDIPFQVFITIANYHNCYYFIQSYFIVHIVANETAQLGGIYLEFWTIVDVISLAHTVFSSNLSYDFQENNTNPNTSLKRRSQRWKQAADTTHIISCSVYTNNHEPGQAPIQQLCI